MNKKHQFFALACSFALLFNTASYADGPPQSNGVISNPTLVKNQDVAAAQAAGTISTFMSQGAQTCDDKGQNCHSVFGADDSVDYSSLQASSQSLTGVQAFSFLGQNDGSTDGGDSSAVAAQLGTLAIACGDTGVKKVAGVVVKVSNCVVTSTGDAQVTLQVCTGPSRSNPVTPPKNEFPCSNDPTSPNFTAPQGYVCHRPACDTEPLNSLDGWSAPTTVSFSASLPANASDDTVAKNGLGMIFYPPLNGGVVSFDADSDNMTAVKVVQTFIDNDTRKTAVGLKVAYRHKTQVTKDMMVQGPSSVPNPSNNSGQWDTILKLQGNAAIPQYQQKYGANGTDCLQQIQGGIAKDGKITVCDTNYTNESGIKPLATTAQVAAEGQDCGTTPQCLNKVVNTTTWTETCSADVPMAMRNCETKTDYTIDHLSYVRTRTKEQCHETRSSAEYQCNTYVQPEQCQQQAVINQGGVDIGAGTSDTSVVLISGDGITDQFRMGAIGNDYWSNGYYSRLFYVDIVDAAAVTAFQMYQVGYDDEVAVAINGNWVFADFPGASYDPSRDQWGYADEECTNWDYDGYGCLGYTTYWVNYWERQTSWQKSPNVDMRPYLHNGRNVIRMDVGVGGKGEGWMLFNISAWKLACVNVVYNNCAQFEAAR